MKRYEKRSEENRKNRYEKRREVKRNDKKGREEKRRKEVKIINLNTVNLSITYTFNKLMFIHRIFTQVPYFISGLLVFPSLKEGMHVHFLQV